MHTIYNTTKVVCWGRSRSSDAFATVAAAKGPRTAVVRTAVIVGQDAFAAAAAATGSTVYSIISMKIRRPL